MPDQNRTNQTTPQGQPSTERGESRRGNDESIGQGGSRRRSNREPAEIADDRGTDDPRRNVENIDELDTDTAIESDLDDVDDMGEDGRSNR
jgi:hypothetical protein